MKRNLFLLILFALATGFSSCLGQGGVQKMSVADFEKKINAAEGAIILDVRTPNEYRNGHLVNSTLIDYYRSDFKEAVNQLDKNKPVFVYCQSGIRSAKAARVLVESGFKEVYDLNGGYAEWAGARKPVVK